MLQWMAGPQYYRRLAAFSAGSMVSEPSQISVPAIVRFHVSLGLLRSTDGAIIGYRSTVVSYRDRARVLAWTLRRCSDGPRDSSHQTSAVTSRLGKICHLIARVTSIGLGLAAVKGSSTILYSSSTTLPIPRFQ